MKEKILETLSRIMEISPSDLHENSSIDTVENWDSMKHIHLILALEEEFEVKFSEQQVMQMLSVEAIFETIKSVRQK